MSTSTSTGFSFYAEPERLKVEDGELTLGVGSEGDGPDLFYIGTVDDEALLTKRDAMRLIERLVNFLSIDYPRSKQPRSS